MRPRRFGPRKLIGWGWEYYVSTCFNEAAAFFAAEGKVLRKGDKIDIMLQCGRGISRRGRLRRVWRMHSSTTCFNAAAAFFAAEVPETTLQDVAWQIVLQ